MSFFRRVLFGSVLAAALVAVPTAPFALASHTTPAVTATPNGWCVNCWPA